MQTSLHEFNYSGQGVVGYQKFNGLAKLYIAILRCCPKRVNANIKPVLEDAWDGGSDLLPVKTHRAKPTN